MKRVKVFLSYSSVDKVLAGNIKHELERFGLEVFLAHEDIEPTDDWVKVILSELEKCDVFIALFTSAYPSSNWTGQECGFALAMGSFIISLKVDINPYGFLSKNQAMRFGRGDVSRSCVEIARTINRNKKLKKRFLDGACSSFCNSDSWAEAKAKSSFLVDFDGFNRSQVNEIIRGAINNSQIHGSFGASANLHSFIHKYRTKGDANLVKSLRSRIG